MRRLTPALAHAALALTLIAFSHAPARAEWLPLGNPVCTAPGDQTGGNFVPDGSGGAIIFWLDARRGFPNTDLYATRILADGSIAPGWPANGVVLAETGRVTLPSGAPDGAGGLLVFWFDQIDYKPRMQHVDGSGALAPGFPANGMILPIQVGGSTGYIVRAVTDGAGGAYFLWNNQYNTLADTYNLTRVTGTGAFAPGWSATGVQQAMASAFNPFSGFSSVALARDPSGGTLVATSWFIEEFIGGYTVGQVCRTLPDGTVAYTVGLGTVTAAPNLTADGSGGAFVAWGTSGDPSLRMQYHQSSGAGAWPSPTAAPVREGLLEDGSGGLYLLGRPPGIDRLELHRRATDASIPSPWTPAGLVLSAAGPYRSFAMARSDDLLYVCWSDWPNQGNSRLRASAVTADGALATGWQAGGTLVLGTGGQILTALGPMPWGHALVVWQDNRTGDASWNIYATLLQSSGPATLDALGERPSKPVSLAFATGPSPNPARGPIGFSFTLADDGPATLEIVDVTGRVWERHAARPTAGAQSLTADVSRLPAGLYWGRLRQGAREVAARFAVTH